MARPPIDSDDFYFAEPARFWRSTSAKAAVQVLTGSEFVQLRIPEYYDHLALNCGRDFKNIRKVAKFIPLFLNDKPHKEIRKQLAVYLRGISGAVQRFEDDAVALVSQLMRQVGPLDMVSEIVHPIIRDMAFKFTGLDYVDGVSEIVIGSHSLRATHKMDAAIGQILAQSEARFPDEDEEQRALRVVFNILGADPLGSSMARSFQAVMTGAEKHKISELDWRETFTATGLEFMIRECRRAPDEQSGEAICERPVQLDMTRFLTDSGANPNHIFGVGNHACLGRGVSLNLWKRIVDDMRQNPMRVTYVKAEPSLGKIVNFPVSFQIEVLK